MRYLDPGHLRLSLLEFGIVRLGECGSRVVRTGEAKRLARVGTHSIDIKCQGGLVEEDE